MWDNCLFDYLYGSRGNVLLTFRVQVALGKKDSWTEPEKLPSRLIIKICAAAAARMRCMFGSFQNLGVPSRRLCGAIQ